MKKQEAIQLLGGTPTLAAGEIGITPAAIAQWPDELPARLIDRVQAALYRRLSANAVPGEGDGTVCPCRQSATPAEACVVARLG